MAAITPRMTVVIADDEPLARRRLSRLLGHHPHVEVVAYCATGDEVVKVVQKQRPDAVFLDVRMPGLNGFEALAEFDSEPLPHIVFVTAYDEYAVRAFDVEAVDYLVKPIDEKRLSESLDRLRARRDRAAAEQNAGDVVGLLLELKRDQSELQGCLSRLSRHGGARHLLLKDGPNGILVSVDDVDWIRAEDNHVRVHTRRQEYLVRRTLSGLEAILDPESFVRIHRSVIVNLDRVARLAVGYGGSYLILLKDGTELTLSRGYRDHLLGRLGISL